MVTTRLQPGQIMGQFTILNLVHRGGMAQLYTVQGNEGDQRQLLMKVPVINEGEDPAAIVSFEMEQMIMPRLKGVHVPRWVANGDFSVHPYIVMEQLEGTSLKYYIDEGKLPLPFTEVARIAAQVADALESLHRQSVVHLDIKPSNIMFRPSGEAVLIDYGLARHRELPDLLQEEFRLPYGTAPYMAPEQVMGIRSDPRSDLFALGCLMYFFATGTRPFGDPQTLKGLKKRLWRDPVPPRALTPDIPPWFQEIVLRCLEVNANRRYPTAAQLAHDLRNPESVELSARAEKLKADSFFTVLKRKGEPANSLIAHAQDEVAAASEAPIVAVALDLNTAQGQLAELLQTTVNRIIEKSPDARVACLNVLKLNRIAMDTTLDEEGQSKHVQRLVGLKDWAHPLKLAAGRVTFHVLSAVDPGDAILEYCRVNHVDHVVMGARENSTMRKLLGSVSGKVAAEAPCSVTVVRARSETHDEE